MHWPVQIWPRPRALIVIGRAPGRRRTDRDDNVARKRKPIQTAIEADVLDGLSRIIGADRPVFVVMVRLPLPVKQGMLDFSAVSKGTRLTCDHEEMRECERERDEEKNVSPSLQARIHE